MVTCPLLVGQSSVIITVKFRLPAVQTAHHLSWPVSAHASLPCAQPLSGCCPYSPARQPGAYIARWGKPVVRKPCACATCGLVHGPTYGCRLAEVALSFYRSKRFSLPPSEYRSHAVSWIDEPFITIQISISLQKQVATKGVHNDKALCLYCVKQNYRPINPDVVGLA